MTSKEEKEYQNFEQDVRFLVDTLGKCFESEDAEYYIDDHNDTLIIKLEGLDEYPEFEIEAIAAPIFEELDMGFEEIILLPL